MTKAPTRDGSLPLGSCAADRMFSWRGLELDGRRRRGKLVAENAATARALLERRNIVALSLLDRGKAPAPSTSAREVTAFTRHLASLLRAGVPLAQGLELLGNALAANGMSRIANALARSIGNGAGFAASLAQFPAQFDALYRQLAAVGEASGLLAAALARIAEERERAAASRAKVRAAVAYPLSVLVFATAVAAALLLWVVPAFQQVFQNFGAPLPAATRAVIALSEAVADAGCPALALAAGLAIVAARLTRHSPRARLALHRAALAVPIIGPLASTLACARFCRALGTLLGAGTPLADALSSLARLPGNDVFKRATLEVSARLDRGQRLADAMAAVRCFAPSIVQSIAIAEESGSLDAMLLDVAALAEQEANEKLAWLANSAEPLVVIALGVLIGGLVVALYLPVIELGNVV
jgi:type IV pilus assembly protein PilC